MRRFTLLFITLLSVTAMYGQWDIDCATAEGMPDVILPGALPYTSAQTTLVGNDGNYVPTTITVDAVSYYAFTVPTTGFHEVTVSQNPAGVPPATGNFSIGLQEAPCPFDGTGDAEIGYGNITAGNIAGSCSELFAGTTYILAVANEAGGAGDINITVASASADANEDCGSPTILTNGVLTPGDNACATGEAYCSLDATADHVVYFEYTVASTVGTDLTILVEADGSPTSAIDAYVGVWTDCFQTAYTGTEVQGDDPCDALVNSVSTPLNYECVLPGTVLTIAVGSPHALDGTFNITVTEDNTGVPLNDVCTGAVSLGTLNDCEWQPFTLDNTNACPEPFEDTGCDLDMDAVVWYSVTLPADATGLEVGGITGGGYAAIFASCPSGAFESEAPGCISATDLLSPGEVTGLTGGNTYFIAAAITGGGEGTFDIQLKAVVPPTNDECDVAMNPALTNGVGVDGTTACADADFTYCAVGAGSHDVFYTYTNLTGANVDIDVDIIANTATTGTAAGDVSVAILTDCGGTAFSPEECNVLGTTFTVECVANNEQIILVIASPDNSEGDFNITITEDTTQPGAMNDNCTDASDVTPTATCAWEVMGVDNISACPEAFNVSGGCDFATDQTVWYEFTVPSTGTDYSVEFQNISGTAYMAMFNDVTDCESPIIEPGVGCMSGALVQGPFTVSAGTTYWLAVGDAAEVAHTFEIRINELPANDECDAAVMLTAGTPLEGTTACATQENPVTSDGTVCGDDLDEVNTVWYTYTVPAGDKGFNITVSSSATGASPIPVGSNVNIVAYETASPACDFSTVAGESCDAEGMLVTEFECVGPGDYTIRIATSAANEGDITIEITALAEVQPNDQCDAANTTAFAGIGECVWTQTLATTTGACPESFDFTNDCGFDDFPVVWYEVTAPAGATLLDLRINSATVGTPFLAVFESSPVDCDNVTEVGGSDCYTGTFTDLVADGETLIDVVGGTTYLIGVGTQDLAGGDIDFEIKFIVPPVNDECDDAEAVTAGSALAGTTNCATQEDPISFDSGVCVDDDEVNTVWYSYTVPAGDKGFNITITATGADQIPGGSDINIVTFETTSPTCDFAGTDVGEVCTTSGTLEQEFECVGPGDYVIRVSTSTANEGDFEILIEALTAVAADFCDDPETTSFAGIAECVWTPATAMTVGACPESFDYTSDCGFDDFPVVWYEVTAPAGATLLDIRINSATTGTPFLGVFEGGAGVDCDNMTVVTGSNCYTGTFTDLVADGQTLIDVVGGTTYLIGVGTQDVAGGDIDFEIKFIAPPANDECDAAEAVTAGVTLAGTTACATQEDPITFDSAECTDDDEVNTVWYEYTVPAGDKGFNITVTSGAVDGFMGDVNIVVFETTSPTCDFAGTDVGEVCTTSGSLEMTFECVGPGDYVIRISTSTANEGSFDLDIEALIEEQTNDDCNNAEVVNLVPDCVFVSVSADNTGACPEDFMGSSCEFDEDNIIWYELELPAGGVGFEFDNFIGDTYLGVFDNDCDNLTLVGTLNAGAPDCIDDNAQILDLAPGTYLVGVGLVGMAEGTVGFDVKTIVPPVNDDPCEATSGSAYDVTNTGDVDVTVMGTNECATQEFSDPACADQDAQASVYYYYETPAGTNGITVTLTNTGDGQQFMVGGYTFADCNGLPTQFDGEVDPECTLEDGSELKFTCLEEGDIIILMVSTEPDETGTFDLTINPTVPDPLCVDNDLCDDADDASPIAAPVTNDDFVCVDDCNIDACPEDFTAGACDYGEFPTVFYSITTDDLMGEPEATLAVILTSTDGTPLNPFFSVFDGCATLTALMDAFCVQGDGTSASQTGIPVEPNTTYIIAVSLEDFDDSDGLGGNFELCVKVSTSCNDDPCTPLELSPGVFAPECDTNIDATEDNTYANDCGGTDQTSSSVYFTYTGNANVAQAIITVTNDNATNGTGLPGDAVLTVFEYDAANCDANFVNTQIDQDCGSTDGAGLEVIIDCPVLDNVYLIQVATAEGNEGDFDIIVEEVLQTSDCATNDICDEATELEVEEPYCTWQEILDCNSEACPEEFIDAGDNCDFASSSVVWFTFTTPDGAYGASFEVETFTGNGRPMEEPTFGVFTDNGCNMPPTEADAGSGCLTATADLAELMDMVVEENTTYYIAVGTNSDDEDQGEFNLRYKIDVAPINDDPCNDSDNPPYDLSGGGSHDGTTCCARGFNDPMNGDDLRNIDCSTITDDNAVWYMYTPTGDEDGFMISVTGNGITGNTAVEAYWGAPDAGCTQGILAETATSGCGALPFEDNIGNCPPNDGDVLFVKVASQDDDCGEFNIVVEPASCGEFANECDEITDAQILEPMTDPNFEIIEEVCVTSCLDFACNWDAPVGDPCSFADWPTVWFQVNTDDIAAQIFAYVEPQGTWDGVWSIYQGDGCDALEQISTAASLPCNTQNDPVELLQQPVDETFSTYWVAVSVDPNSLPADGSIDDGGFELCVYTTINAIVCLGEIAGNCQDESLTMEITEREQMDQPLEGPFCQGEEITVSVTFNYDASETGVDWLIGFVPEFGPGWDLENFDFDANAPSGNGSTAQWYDEDGDCAPILQEPLPHMCTYEDEDGNLRLCNALCEACSDCPNGIGMMQGDPLPSGYFWVTNGGNAGCDNDCSPGEGWGIGTTVVDITWEFTLTVKDFDTVEECLENRSLRISFQTFSDGVGGCWEDPVGECLIDRLQVGPDWVVDCNAPPTVIGDDVEICSGDEAGLTVETIDGTVYPIEVTFMDNPFVDGEGTGTNGLIFPDGFGTINDVLVNNSPDVQEVIYSAVVVAPDDFTCPGNPTEFIVTVYPDLIVEFIPDPDYVCQGECKTIIPVITGGTGNIIDYQWETGESSPDLEVCPEFLTTYVVTVTDDLGCTGVGQVDVDVKDSLVFELGPDLYICQDGIFDGLNPQFIVSVDVEQGSAPISWVYDPEVGLIGNEVFPGAWAINEEASVDAGGDGLDLCFVGTDFFGCSSEKCIKIFISGEPEIIIIEEDLDCGETEFCFDVQAEDVNFNPIPNLIIRDCDGNLLWDFDGSFTGYFNPPCFDLNEVNCFEITAFDPLSGCEAIDTLMKMPTTGEPIMITDVSVCEGDEATVTIANGSDYTTFEWTVAGDASMTIVSMTDSYTFTPDSTTTLFVNTEDADGCTASESAVVTFNPSPIVALADTFTFCAGGSATAEASGGLMYEWTVGATVVSMTPTYTSSNDGEVATVTITDENGCTASASTVFLEESEITINIIGQDLCDGAETVLSFAGDFTEIVWSDGTMDVDSITVTAGGTYTVTATSDGCPASGTITIEEFTTPVIDVVDLVDVCRDDSGVDSITVNLDNQVMGDAGSWSQVDVIPAPFVYTPPNLTFLGVPAGQYRFVYASNSATAPCMDVTDTLTINVKTCPCPSVDVRDPDPICNDGGSVDLNSSAVKLTGEDGTWTVESGPPTQDLSMLISGGVFTASAGTLPGDYGVLFTLADSGGPNCQTDSLITVTVIDGPQVTVLDDGLLCNITGGDNPTTVDLNTLITTNTPGVWSDADGPLASDIVDGENQTPETLTFIFTTTLDADSPCEPVSVTVDVVIRDCNCPLIIVADSLICNDALPVLLDDLLTNPDGIAGTWSTSAASGTIVNGNEFDPSMLNNGQFTITYTIDAGDVEPGCPLTYEGTITVSRQPVLSLLMPPAPCSADTGNGATTTNLYDWIDDDGTDGTWTLISGPNMSIPIDDQGNDVIIVDFDSETPGSEYVFTYQANSAQDPPCMNPSITITIEVADCECPPIELVTPDPVCNDGGTIDLITLVDGSTTGNPASDPGTFTVIRTGTSNDVMLSGTILDYTGLTEGSYTITFTLDEMVTGSCTQSLEVQLEVSNYRTITMDPELTICNNTDNGNMANVSFLTLPSNGGIGTWNQLDGDVVDLSTLANVSFVGVAPGLYRFEYVVVNDAPCPEFRDTIAVTVDPCDCPLIQPGFPTTECVTDNNNMIDLTQYDDPDQAGTWSSTDFTITNGILDATGAMAGTYILIYTIDNPGDPMCPTTEEREIMFVLPATAGMGRDTSVCFEDDALIDLFELITGEDTGGSWTEIGSNSGGLDGLAGTFNSTGITAGVYQLQYGFEANGECPESFTSVVITIDDLPMADAGADFELSCDFPMQTLGGPGTSMGGDFEYLWEETGSGITVPDGTTATPTISAPGTYVLTVINTATGCMEMDEVVISESDDKPTMDIEATDITCNGDNDGFLTISNQMGGDGNYEYSIDGVNFTDLDGISSEITNMSGGEYTIIIRDGNGCSTPYPFTIVDPAPVVATIAGSASPVIIETGEEVTILLEVPTDTTGLTIVWSTLEAGGPVVATDVTSITVTPEETTTYYVVVTDANGCFDEDEIQIQPNQNVDVTFPNIIDIGDNDGNNTFFVNSDDVKRVDRMSIYDRWGNLVFIAEDVPPNDPTVGWDGTFNGQDVVPGVYVFYVELTFIDDNAFSTAGDVTIIR